MVDIVNNMSSKNLFDNLEIKKLLDKTVFHDFFHFFIKFLFCLFQGFFFTEMLFLMFLRCLFHRYDIIKK